MVNFKNFFLIILFFVPNCISQERFFNIVVASWNNKTWYKKHLDSIFNQKYSNYRVIYVDDCSTDGTADLVEEYTKKRGFGDKLLLIRNKRNVRALTNIYKSIINFCADDDLVLLLDGDDWLRGDCVLKTINEAYNDPAIWLTYGTYIDVEADSNDYMVSNGDIDDSKLKLLVYPGGKISDPCGDITAGGSVVPSRKNSKLLWRGIPGHPKTFYAWLFKSIHLKDLFSCGTIAEAAYDVTIGCPLFEMAAHHFKFIKQVLYVHNLITPLNDTKIKERAHAQKFILREMFAKSLYKNVEQPAYVPQTFGCVSVFIFTNHQNIDDNDLAQRYKLLRGVNHVYVIDNNNMRLIGEKHSNSTLNKIYPLSSLSELVQNDRVNYVLLATADIIIDSSVDFDQKIKLLEITKAYNYSLIACTNKSEQLLHDQFLYSPLDSCNAYQFKYAKGVLANPLNFMATIYRKRDFTQMIKNIHTFSTEALSVTVLDDEIGLF